MPMPEDVEIFRVVPIHAYCIFIVICYSDFLFIVVLFGGNAAVSIYRRIRVKG